MTEILGPAPSSVEPYGVRLLNSNAHLNGSKRLVGLHSRTTLPRGLGGRYDFLSIQDRGSCAFAKFNPQARPPADYAALAPLRDDVPLLDPCSGQLSAGAEVALEIKGRQKFIDFHHVPSALWVPPDFRERPQTPQRPSASTCDMSDDKAWNSRRIPDAALRASLGGWTSSVRVKPKSPKIPSSVKFPSLSPGNGTGQDTCLSDPSERRDQAEAVKRFIYTSVSQRSYENVDWDAKLPRRLKAPATTFEKMADPVSQYFSGQRYHSQPQLWQAIGPQWNRHQLRARNNVRKPISFSSPCPKSGQIPLYCGVVGSENMDNIDNIHEDFHPLTMQRTSLPQYTPTAHRTTIPGYAGKAVYATSGRPGTGVSLPNQSTSAHTPGTKQDVRTRTRTGPLSKMVRTVAPWNPFLQPKTLGSPI